MKGSSLGVFGGYMADQSGGAPELFSLTCLVSHDSMRVWFEFAWNKVLDRGNAQLRAGVGNQGVGSSYGHSNNLLDRRTGECAIVKHLIGTLHHQAAE